MKVTKKAMFVETLKRSLQYNMVEITLLFLFIGDQLIRDTISVTMLWIGFVGTVLWVLITSMKEAEMELFQGLKRRELYLTDFLSAFLVFLALAWVVRHEGFQFWLMYLVAAAQHLRYTALSYKCLVKEREHDQKYKTDKDSQQGS